MGIAAAIGITLGALAGYFGGWVDMLLSRLIEVVMCIPSLVLILALVAVLETADRSGTSMAVLGVTGWTGIARLTRAEFLKLKADGIRHRRPRDGRQPRRGSCSGTCCRNALAPVLVPITFGIAAAILIESGLSFLGFGACRPTPAGARCSIDGRENHRRCGG